MQNQTKAEQLFAWLLEELGKVPELGFVDVGKVEESGSLTLGLSTDDGEYVFVTVEQG
jgi:hypothetical protein